MRKELRPLDSTRQADFYRLHSDENGHGWCCCAAWWVPTWDGWGDRTAEENHRLRDELFARREYDGYLLYVEGEPVGWCQVGRRDRLEKLVRQFERPPDPDVYAVTCFFIAPGRRRRGLARFLLAEVIRDLGAWGVDRVEAYPKRGEGLDAGELWTGPEALFTAAGFEVVKDDPAYPVLILNL